MEIRSLSQILTAQVKRKQTSTKFRKQPGRTPLQSCTGGPFWFLSRSYILQSSSSSLQCTEKINAATCCLKCAALNLCSNQKSLHGDSLTPLTDFPSCLLWFPATKYLKCFKAKERKVPPWGILAGAGQKSTPWQTKAGCEAECTIH